MLMRVARISVHLLAMTWCRVELKDAFDALKTRCAWISADLVDASGCILSVVVSAFLLEGMLRPYLPLPSTVIVARRSPSPPDVIHPRAMLHRPFDSDDDEEDEEETPEILPRRRRMAECGGVASSSSCDDI